MKCYKFLLPDTQLHEMGEGITVGGMLLLVIDENVEAARERGRAWLDGKARFSRWLDHQDVVITTHEITSPVVLIGAEF